MAAYVLFTVFLCQRGSSESRRPGAIELVDVDARDRRSRMRCRGRYVAVDCC